MIMSVREFSIVTFVSGESVAFGHRNLSVFVRALHFVTGPLLCLA